MAAILLWPFLVCGQACSFDLDTTVSTIAQLEKDERADFVFDLTHQLTPDSCQNEFSDFLFDLGKSLKRIDKSLSYQCFAALSSEFPTSRRKSESEYQLGVLMKNQGELDSAIYFYEKSATSALLQEDSVNWAYSQMGLGATEKKRKNLPKSINYFLSSLQTFSNYNDSLGQSKSLVNLSNAFFETGQFEEAITFSKEARNLATQLNDLYVIGIASGNLSSSFLELARIHGEPSFLDSSEKYIASTLETFPNLHPYDLNALLECRGHALFDKGEYTKALSSFEEVYLNYSSFNFVEGQAASKSSVASCLIQLNQPEKAINASLLSLGIQREKGLEVNLSENFQILKDAYALMGDSNMALSYSDSLHFATIKEYEDEKAAISLELLEKYEAVENERLILEQHNTNLKNQQTIQSQQTKQNYLLGSGLFALLIGGYALRSQRKKRKASELALIEREAAAEREVEELMQQHRYATLAASIDAEEKERDRLSKELHDGVGSTISGIAMQLEAIRNEQEVEALSPLLIRLRSSYDELRALSRNIGMPAIQENTLVELTGTLLANVQADSSLQLNYVVFPKEEAFNIDQRIEIAVYRVIQEAMNNIMKHAQASMVEVQLTKSEAELDVMIEDDGKGFDANVLAKGIGLKNMKDRVEAMGGEFHIDARPGKGTILSLSVPLKQ